MQFQDPAWLGWERKCLERIRRGERDAFGELYEAFAAALYARVLLPRLGNPAAAEEALAETFRMALERLDQFSDRQLSIWHWLVRIATNKATDIHRERARTGKALSNFVDLLGPLTPPEADPGSALEHRREQEQLRAAVARTLERLNPRYRKAIELRILADESRQACAEQLQVSVPTFDVVLLRALRAFRKEWSAEMSSEKPKVLLMQKEEQP
jgi:RNA polymerase sigma-70 factor (ECF subfamily)